MADLDSQLTQGNGGNSSNGERLSLAEVMMTMERSRKQAEKNQARIMETQAKMLEQIANKLAEPRESREPRREIRKPRWGDFQKTNPPIFMSSDEPLDADDWLKDMERRLNTLECNDKEKVL